MSLDAAAVLDFFGYMALTIRSCRTFESANLSKP